MTDHHYARPHRPPLPPSLTEDEKTTARAVAGPTDDVDRETHMRHTVDSAAPTALCDPAITADLSPDVDAVTCHRCRRWTFYAIAEEQRMREQAAAESDD